MAWVRFAVVSSVSLACGPAIDLGDDGGESGSSSDSSGPTSLSAGPTSTTVDPPDPTTPTTSPPDPSLPSTVTTVTTDPSQPTTATDPSDTTDPTGEGLPDGAACDDGLQCASGHCYVLEILGGVCGECESDADCDGGGCTLPNPLASPPTPSACNDGSYGDGCESDAVCGAGLQCGSVIDVPGIVTVSTCGECELVSDCDADWTCEPDIALAAFTGVQRCVAPGTLANGQTCNLEWGATACASGHCAPADVMGVLFIGVCSACSSDAECGALTCAPPEVGLDGTVVPGACEP